MRREKNKRHCVLTLKTERTYRGVSHRSFLSVQRRLEKLGGKYDGMSYFYSFETTCKGLKVYFCNLACGKDNQDSEHEVTFIRTKVNVLEKEG